MTKRDKTKDSEYKGRDLKRDRSGWKAQLKDARRAKGKRRDAEGAVQRGWN